MSIPYESPRKNQEGAEGFPADQSGIDYLPYSLLKTTILSNEDVLGRFSKYKIPSEGVFIPQKMEVRTRDGIKAIQETRRLVVLGKGNLHYKVFRLPQPTHVENATDMDVLMS